MTSYAPGSVGAAMIRWPKLCRSDLTVAEARTLFTDDHVHALLIVDDGVLVSVVERPDLVAAHDTRPAVELGTRAGRTIVPSADAAATMRSMGERGRRRLAVVTGRAELLGLLCLRRSGTGFCTDEGVRARALSRRPGGAVVAPALLAASY